MTDKFYKVNNQKEFKMATDILIMKGGNSLNGKYEFFPCYVGINKFGWIVSSSTPIHFTGTLGNLAVPQFDNVYYTVKNFSEFQMAIDILINDKNYKSIISDYQLEKEFFNEVLQDGNVHIVGNKSGNVYLGFTFRNDQTMLPGFTELYLPKQEKEKTYSYISVVNINGKVYREDDIISLIKNKGIKPLIIQVIEE